MKNEPETYTGFLAYFDLLGFSNRITEKGFEEFDRYYNIIDRAVGRFPNIDYRFFSDSVIVYTRSLDQSIFQELIKVVSKIFFRLVTHMSLSLCGAISCGEFSIYETKGNVMISGSPMVDAVHWESMQNWIGIMITPTVIDRVDIFKELINDQLTTDRPEDLFQRKGPWWSYLYMYNEIPLKDSENKNVRAGFCLVPHDEGEKLIDILKDLENFRRKLAIMKFSVPNSYVQNKFTNTDRMLEKLLPYYHALVNQ